MAVNNVITDNVLWVNKVGTVADHYWNAAWVDFYFSSTHVYLRYNSQNNSTDAWNENPVGILLADFELGGVSYTTEATIATALSAVVG